MTSPSCSRRARVWAPTLLILTGLLTALGAVHVAAPAHADGRVSVANEEGTPQADLRYRTELTVRGSGFQVVPGGFGGVYVMFGWVRDPAGGSWRPSRGGLTGQDYQYIPDSEDVGSSAGYLRFLAFPGGATSGEANGVLSASGGFRVTLTVPGPVFESVDRSGQVARVDCREVRCGVITIGAHGVANARNESFTPVSFAEVLDVPSSAQPTPAEPSPAAGAGERAGEEATTDGSSGRRPTHARRGSTAQRARPAALTVDRTTAVAGRAMAFTARGFASGEQVVAVLDDGRSAVGPLTAGASGEVAAAVQLPTDLAPGTHELRLTGAASGTEVSERFAAAAESESGPATSTAAPEQAEPGAWTGTPGALFLSVATALFLLAALHYSVLLARRRRLSAGAGVG